MKVELELTKWQREFLLQAIATESGYQKLDPDQIEGSDPKDRQEAVDDDAYDQRQIADIVRQIKRRPKKTVKPRRFDDMGLRINPKK